MSQTFVGFNHGQYGDLFIGLCAAAVLKNKYPNSKLLYSINKKYSDCADIFKYCPHIDGTVIWDEYDNWPGQKDIDLLNGVIEKYPNAHLFHPNAKHKRNDWYLFKHQTAELCDMHNLPEPTKEQMQLHLNKPQITKAHNEICVCPYTSFGQIKNLSDAILDTIRDFATRNQFNVIQLGSEQDKTVEGFIKFNGTYADSIKKMLSSRFLVSADTGMIWAASAFQHPTIGFYARGFYRAPSCQNWTPINPNLLAIEADYVSDIDGDTTHKVLDRFYSFIQE